MTPVSGQMLWVSLYGVYDWTFRGSPYHAGLVQILETVVVGKRIATHPELFRDASPIKHIRKDAPPFLIVHGTADWLTPVQGGSAIPSQAVRSVGVGS
jgi:dipeptidyl aminopeptidase/acylaminoacyl peptidase